ncbi:MAG: hypothetical protein M1608_12480 [Candidatus Omnitrophica bacterium]|nr:hypothetical protein [Candidatus Omnitrophota bacterium]
MHKLVLIKVLERSRPGCGSLRGLLNLIVFLVIAALSGSSHLLIQEGWGMTSGDAYVRQQGSQWTMGTSALEKVVALEGGQFRLTSLKNKSSGYELIPAGAESDEFLVSLGTAADQWDGGRGGWQLVGTQERRLAQGELQLDITLRGGPLLVTKSYVIYPGSSIIREWVTYQNADIKPIQVVDPAFLNLQVRNGKPEALDFLWMTGGENDPGSWDLRTEKLSSGKTRAFDSYEPFPFGSEPKFAGDGIKARIMLNDRQVWPKSGWQYVANALVRTNFDFTVDLAAGDKLIFQVNMNGNVGNDTTEFDPTITDENGESCTASQQFSGKQGKNNWQYQYIKNGKFIDMVYDAPNGKWRREGSTDIPWISADSQHPDGGQDAVRVWTASKAGRVRVTGSVCNTGNGGSGGSHYGFRPGTSSYAPWYALYNRDTQEGVFIGWDYFGHWTSSFGLSQDGAVKVQLKVAGHHQILEPGASVTTPKAFVGLYRSDLDNAGNECLDWQYRYLWDYTRNDWFPAIRMQGFWPKGTSWGSNWAGGGADFASTYRKIFRVADLMRYCGADVYHRDWGWWDRAGDWNGPDFRSANVYLRKNGMGMLIYAFLYTVDPQSKVAREHPDWVVGGSTLDMSRPEVVEFMKGQLDGFVERWGRLEWRNDSFFTCPLNPHDDTPLLGQDQGFRRVIQGFLDRHPDCAFQSVNGGGNYGGYDYTRFSSSFSFSDGAVGVLRNYYAALLFPPDKTSDIPEVSPPYDYDKATWRGKLCINFDMYGDTWDPAKLEGVRQLVDIYHYLQHEGVVGRWVKVYRPLITGDDPTMYFERLSGDRRRSILIPKHPAPGPVVIKPKGLLPSENYFVSFQEATEISKRTGADLMAKGIEIQKMLPGELIYLNLPLHPGSKLDTEPPTAPTRATKRWAENMGYPGLELSWKKARTTTGISYYDVYRGGVYLDRVAKGTYYFDHSAGADLAADYEICAVDGAGNASAKTVATGPIARLSSIFDDAAGGGISFTGEWQRQSQLEPAYCGTIAFAKEKGATAELTFQGKKILWFAKLGDDCGKAQVSIDDVPVEVVDTYSADDIWGACVFQKELPNGGTHTLRISVLGERSRRSKGDAVYVDGVRAEP